MRITVIGAGSWGTTVAALAARGGHDVVLWARRAELAEAIDRQHRNPDYLPDFELPAELRATADLRAAVDHGETLVIGVPSHGFRDVVRAMPPIDTRLPIVSLTKGIERETLLRMTEVVLDERPDHDPDRVGVLTGPNLAKEVMAGQPTAAVVGMRSHATAEQIQRAFMRPTFRVYTNPDVVGCELAGALKNCMAIAAGFARGLGYGDNTLATLITRALAELTRLGVAMGGRPETFAGLAGMGDLIATCISDKSRNNRVGFELARGRKLSDIVAEMQMVAEGVKTTEAILELARRHAVEMPIATEVGRVLYEGAEPQDAVLRLMTRDPKPEIV